MSEETVKVEGSEGEQWANIFPKESGSYDNAFRRRLPRAQIYKDVDRWGGKASSCGTLSAAFSENSYKEALTKAVGIVKRALEEVKS